MKQISINDVKEALKESFVVTQASSMRSSKCSFEGIFAEYGEGDLHYHYDTKAFPEKSEVTILFLPLIVNSFYSDNEKEVYITSDKDDLTIWTYDQEGFYKFDKWFEWKDYSNKSKLFVALTHYLTRELD